MNNEYTLRTPEMMACLRATFQLKTLICLFRQLKRIEKTKNL